MIADRRTSVRLPHSHVSLPRIVTGPLMSLQTHRLRARDTDMAALARSWAYELSPACPASDGLQRALMADKVTTVLYLPRVTAPDSVLADQGTGAISNEILNSSAKDIYSPMRQRCCDLNGLAVTPMRNRVPTHNDSL